MGEAPIPDTRAIALFLNMMAAERGAAANTLAAYRRDLEGASEMLGGGLAAARPEALETLFARLADRAPATLSRKRSALRCFFALLVAEGIRPDNPALALAPVKAGRRLPRTLLVAEVDQLLATATAEAAARPDHRTLRLRALLELLYGSGLRATELVALPRNAIRPDQPYAIVRGKGGRERLVPVSPAARAAVDAHLRHVPAEARWMFPSGAAHLSRVRLFQLVRALGARAGLPPERLSPHVLRHAFATHMLANGADLRAIQTLLGHADIGTTERYLHVEASRLVTTVRRLHPLA